MAMFEVNRSTKASSERFQVVRKRNSARSLPCASAKTCVKKVHEGIAGGDEGIVKIEADVSHGHGTSGEGRRGRGFGWRVCR